MQARLTRDGVDPKHLNAITYKEYCKMYLIQKIADILPAIGNIQYLDIITLINSINPALYEKLYTETGKLLLLNKVWILFMGAFNTEISKEYLHTVITEMAVNDPAQYK